ncbi:MAG: hypothetical protein NC231_11320 [Bacillus sp. (in: Bacteria)]|nr:hypothetical protein [Bacillus sp. (in: firmicutes)]MCM1428104.1 hypothetical protein [Eubacterium sp.]
MTEKKTINGADAAGTVSIKELLYATGNGAKLAAMRTRLEPLGLRVTGLRDVMNENHDIAERIKNLHIEEDGNTPLENAEKKASAYYQILKRALFSCDSGLYIENIPDDEQPGVHVRTVHGKYLSDEEMLEYYRELAKKYGDLKARYRNAICFIEDEAHIYSAMEENMASEPFLITSKPHKNGIMAKGFPLDCLSINIKTGKYYYDSDEDELEQLAVEDGFLEFFQKCLCI